MTACPGAADGSAAVHDQPRRLSTGIASVSGKNVLPAVGLAMKVHPP